MDKKSIAGNSFHSHAASNDYSAPFVDQNQASTSKRKFSAQLSFAHQEALPTLTADDVDAETSGLSLGKRRFLDNAHEAGKTVTTEADTAMRFSLAKTHDIEERSNQGLPQVSVKNSHYSISIAKFSRVDGNDSRHVGGMVNPKGKIFEGYPANDKTNPEKVSGGYYESIRKDSDHYLSLYNFEE